MKKVTLLLFATILLLGSYSATAQDEAASPWTVGADFFNRYNWRGTDFGNAPVIQPTIKYATGGFSIGAWGSYSLGNFAGESNPYASEADLFAGYSFKSGTSILFTDYYFPSEPGSTGSYFDYDNAHTFEIGLTQALGSFSLSGYYYLNANDDVYFEAAYAFKNVSLFAGAGNESYTTDGKFNVCNLGISSTKTIAITDKFSLPLIGKVILNPEKEQIFLVVGFSL